MKRFSNVAVTDRSRVQIIEEHSKQETEDGNTQASTHERKRSLGLSDEKRKTAVTGKSTGFKNKL